GASRAQRTRKGFKRRSKCVKPCSIGGGDSAALTSPSSRRPPGRAFLALGDEEHGLARGPGAPHLRAGELGLPPFARGDADLAHRTYRACGPATRAEGGAEVHDALRVGGG